MKNVSLAVGFATLICCAPAKNTEHKPIEGTASIANERNSLNGDTSTSIAQSIAALPNTSESNNELFRTEIQKNLAEAEKDTAQYWFIKVTRETICCTTETRWFFDKNNIQLRFVDSRTEDEGTNRDAYYFTLGVLAGGWEHWGAEDGQGNTFFTTEQSIKGFSDEEDIFTDTTIYLTKEDVIQKIKNIERDKITLLESLREVSLDQWSEENQVIIVEITRPVSDHENEQVRYEISKPLFEKLIKPDAN